jgi:hypothetical protein
MTTPGSSSGNLWPIDLLRIARRLKRERDQTRRELAKTKALLVAYEALLNGAFPPKPDHP